MITGSERINSDEIVYRRLNIKDLVLEASQPYLETLESLIGLDDSKWEDLKKHHTESLHVADILDNTNYPLKNWLTKIKIRTLYPERAHEIVINQEELVRIKEDRKSLKKDYGSYVGYSLILSNFGKIDFDADVVLKGMTDSDYKNIFEGNDKFWQVDLGVAAVKLLRPDVGLKVSEKILDEKIEKLKLLHAESGFYSVDLTEILAAKKILFPVSFEAVDKNLWKELVNQLKRSKDKNFVGFISLAFYMKIIESDEIKFGENGLEIINTPSPILPVTPKIPEVRRFK